MGILIFRCTEGAGVGDYSSGEVGGGEEKNRGTVITSLQLAFTERVVPNLRSGVFFLFFFSRADET